MRMLCYAGKNSFCIAYWEAPLDFTFQGITESSTDVSLNLTTDPPLNSQSIFFSSISYYQVCLRSELSTSAIQLAATVLAWPPSSSG